MKKVITVSGLAGSGKDTFADHVCSRYGFKKDHLARDLKEIARDYFGWDGEKDERGRRLLQLLGTEVGRNRHPFLWLFKFMSKHGLSIPPYAILQHDPLVPLMPREKAEIEETLKEVFKGQDQAAAIVALRGFLWDGRLDKRGLELIKGIKELANWYNQNFESLAAYKKTAIEAMNEADEAEAYGLIIPDVRFKNELEAFKKNGAFSVLIKRPGMVQMQHASEKDLDGAQFDAVIENDGSLDKFYKSIELVMLDVLTRKAS